MPNKINNHKKILVCEDEENIRESLKLILGDKYDMILTDSGEQCLECLNNAKDIGLVLLDIKIPKMNGLEILREIKNRHANIPVVMVTGYNSVETASEASKLGAKGYIVKPFKSDEILKTVGKFVG